MEGDDSTSPIHHAFRQLFKNYIRPFHLKYFGDHGEKIDLGWLYFYCSLLFFGLLLTASRRTGSARFYCAAATFTGAAIEWIVKTYGLIPEDQLSKRFIAIRWIFSLFCLSSIIFAGLFARPQRAAGGSDSSKKKGKKGKTSSSAAKEDIKTMNPAPDQFKEEFWKRVPQDAELKLRVVRGTKPLKQQPVNNQYHAKLQSIAKHEKLNIDSIEFAKHMDSIDPLAKFRDRFHIPPMHGKNEDSIYLCGNSLGLQPKDTRDYINEELDKWQNRAVLGHFEGKRPWFEIDDTIAEQTAHLVGAKPTEVAIMNSLSANIHLLMVSFYRPTPQRYKILIEENPFPSDMWIVTSQVRFHGYNPEDAIVVVGPRPGEDCIHTEDILEILQKEGDSIALVMLGALQFITGQLFDIAKITEEGHKHGCIVGFDCAHAAGNIDLQLHRDNVDFAAWCSYKYLNAGPGNLGGIFVHERHAHDKTLPKFAAWWGNKRETRFKLKATYHPTPGAAGYQLSNPYVLGMVSVLASLNIFEEAGIKNLRNKSYLLTGYLEMLLDANFSKEEVTILTPRDPHFRGCQLSLRLCRSADEMERLLEKNGVVCDKRDPNVIRVAPTPLYNTFEDVHKFIGILKRLIREEKDNNNKKQQQQQQKASSSPSPSSSSSASSSPKQQGGDGSNNNNKKKKKKKDDQQQRQQQPSPTANNDGKKNKKTKNAK